MPLSRPERPRSPPVLSRLCGGRSHLEPQTLFCSPPMPVPPFIRGRCREGLANVRDNLFHRQKATTGKRQQHEAGAGKAEELAIEVIAAIARPQPCPGRREGREEEGVQAAGAGAGMEAGVRDDVEGAPQATTPPQMQLPAPRPTDATMVTRVADGRQAAAAAGAAVAAATGSQQSLPHRQPPAGTPTAAKAGEKEAAPRGATPTTC